MNSVAIARRVGPFLIAVCLLFVAPGALAAPRSEHLQQGIHAYNQAKYLNALQDFLAAVQENYNDATAHYYLANSLACLNQHDESLQEYKIAYCLCPPHSQMAEYCLQALRGEELKKANKHALAQMVGQIRQELAEKGNLLDRQGQIRASENLRTGQLVAASIKASVERYVEYLEANPLVYYTRWGQVQVVPRTEEIAEARERAQRESMSAMQAAHRSAEEAAALAAQKQVAVEELAANLERQFVQPSLSGVKLSAVGTNLYVRNYESVTGTAAPAADREAGLPVPTVAKAKQLALKESMLAHAKAGSWAGPSGNGATAERGKIPAAGTPEASRMSAGRGLINTETRDTTTGVYGKLIKP